MNYPLHHAVYSSLITDPPKISKQKKGSWDDRYERQLIRRFCDFGFTEIIQNKDSEPEDLLGNPGSCDYLQWIDDGRPAFLPEKSVVHQPFSTYRPIDIASYEHGRTFLTESKCSTDESGKGSIQLNTCLPHPDTFYYFSNMIQSVLLRGYHLLNEAERQEFMNYERQLKMVAAPNVEGFISRIRVFYSLKSYRKLFDAYGPLCTQESLAELMGDSTLTPKKHFQWYASATLEEFL